MTLILVDLCGTLYLEYFLWPEGATPGGVFFGTCGASLRHLSKSVCGIMIVISCRSSWSSLLGPGRRRPRGPLPRPGEQQVHKSLAASGVGSAGAARDVNK
jgi:hypothetical protein